LAIAEEPGTDGLLEGRTIGLLENSTKEDYNGK
jgi:hypothetical protein